jgi:hypothetical protein
MVCETVETGQSFRCSVNTCVSLGVRTVFTSCLLAPTAKPTQCTLTECLPRKGGAGLEEFSDAKRKTDRRVHPGAAIYHARAPAAKGECLQGSKKRPPRIWHRWRRLPAIQSGAGAKSRAGAAMRLRKRLKTPHSQTKGESLQGPLPGLRAAASPGADKGDVLQER